MQALVTGGTGFVGSHVVRALLQQGVEVRALVRPTSDLAALAGLPVETIQGNLMDSESMRKAVKGIDLLFHVAADYRLWVPDPQQMYATNVTGTAELLRAAAEAGVRRAVYTSSVVTVDCSKNVGTEADFLKLGDCRSMYQRTKVLAEQAVWEFIRQGMPVTIVNPSALIGSCDRRPTPTGRLIVDYLSGRLPAFMDTILNWVSVEDVAHGHWLAATMGRVGERYILSHTNLSLGEFLAILADVSGQPPPRMRIPYPVAYVAGAVGSAWAQVTKREPQATLDGVRMAGQPSRYDCSKARGELGFSPTPIRKSAEAAVTWFRTHGYVGGDGAR